MPRWIASGAIRLGEWRRDPSRSYDKLFHVSPLVEQETFIRLYRSREFLASNFDQRPSLSQAAREACLSPFHYHRMFVRAFGETPHEFVTRRRIERAKQLLARDECPVTEVCLAVGYESLGSFSTLFRAEVGRSPLEYRRSLRRIFPAPHLAPYRFIPACYLLSFGSRPF
ncbi:Transcriptional regulator, AraC family (modular protein) [Candidatus Sulfopaludibacter sp. SbA3]|nr:Transcriptional regulator, AraC family (modular protein) [Candidatus Sulfopaludibacter sp. SbA3]